MFRPIFALLIGILMSGPAKAGGVEIDAALAMERPYCVDMRIEQERRRETGKLASEALAEYFGCRKLYILPMTISDNAEIMARYADRFSTFKGHDVLVWCTHGVRSARLDKALNGKVPGFRHLTGGTEYLKTVLSLQD